MELNELIVLYKATREERERFEAFHKDKLAGLQKLICAALEAAGLKSAKTEGGQAITSLRRSVRVVDWDEVAGFAGEYPEIIKQSLDSTEALRLIDDNIVIPGTEVTSTFVLTIK